MMCRCLGACDSRNAVWLTTQALDELSALAVTPDGASVVLAVVQAATFSEVVTWQLAIGNEARWFEMDNELYHLAATRDGR